MTTVEVTDAVPMTGATSPEVVFADAWLTSWLMAIVTFPLSLICGVTVRMTPVGRNTIVCAKRLVPSDWTGVIDEDVGTGISAPT